MKPRYTRRAAGQLAKILDYLAEQSPEGQRNISRRLRDMIALLEQYPEVGRLTSKSGMRRLVVTPYPYLVFYRIGREGVVIHGIRHAARKPLQS